jgi:lipoate-protein ligase B
MRPKTVTTPCTVYCLGLVDYQEAWEEQRHLVEACRRDGCDRLLLLEHPPTYTLGVRGQQEHLLLGEVELAELGATVYWVDRGGDVTFHGPGQLVGYPIVDLRRWNQGPVWYVRSLEAVLIEALSAFGIDAQRVPGRPGVWVRRAKIAAIGVRISRGVTSHGFALNVNPDLSYFSHIIPCGLPDVTITSMTQELGRAPDMQAAIKVVIDAFACVFPVEMRAAAAEAAVFDRQRTSKASSSSNEGASR